MNSFSKLLETEPKKWPIRIQIITLCLIMFSINFFPTLMAVEAFIRSSKNLKDLTYVKGKLKDSRIMTHKHESKYRTSYEDVLVVRIDSCDDEFGFIKSNKIYSELSGIVEWENPPYLEIYYDKNRKRIEQNVTLHTSDMT